MPGILPQIQHVVVVMLENCSFDNLCGWLYQGTPPPAQFLPGSSSATPFNGLNPSLFNPVQESYFTDQSGPTYPIFPQSNATNMPNPDPEEDYSNLNYQLFGTEAPNQNPRWPNLGFVINYAKVTGTNIPVQVMEPFSPAQVPVLIWPRQRRCCSLNLGSLTCFLDSSWITSGSPSYRNGLPNLHGKDKKRPISSDFSRKSGCGNVVTRFVINREPQPHAMSRSLGSKSLLRA